MIPITKAKWEVDIRRQYDGYYWQATTPDDIGAYHLWTSNILTITPKGATSEWISFAEANGITDWNFKYISQIYCSHKKKPQPITKASYDIFISLDTITNNYRWACITKHLIRLQQNGFISAYQSNTIEETVEEAINFLLINKIYKIRIAMNEYLSKDLWKKLKRDLKDKIAQINN